MFFTQGDSYTKGVDCNENEDARANSNDIPKINAQTNGYIKTNGIANGYVKTNVVANGHVKTNGVSNGHVNGFIKTNDASNSDSETNSISNGYISATPNGVASGHAHIHARNPSSDSGINFSSDSDEKNSSEKYNVKGSNARLRKPRKE